MSKARLLIAPFIALVRLHRLALGVVAGLLLVYTLAGFLLVPRVARSQIESFVNEELHRRVSIGEIRFNPFVLDASVHDFVLQEADGAALVRFRHLYVNAQLASLWRRAAILHEVQLSAPDIEVVVKKDGSVNLAALARRSAEPEPAGSSAPPRVRVGTLAVTEGRIGIADYTHGLPFTAAVTPIRFTLTDFRTDTGYENAYAFSGTTSAGEQLEWSGAFTIEPLGSTGRFTVRGLKVATVDAYLYESLPFRLATGSVTLAGEYRLGINPELTLDVTLPSAQIRDLSLTERGATVQAPVVAPSIDVEQLALSYGRREVTMKSVVARGTRIAAALEPEGSISLMRLFDDATQDASMGNGVEHRSGDPGNEERSAWSVSADAIQVIDGAMLLEDRTVSPATSFALEPVQATVKQWTADPAQPLQVDADLTINEAGRLLAAGVVQIQPLSVRLAIDLQRFDLPALQPYLARATAMTLHTGTLALEGDVTYAAAAESAQPVTFKGEMQIDDLRTTDRLVNEDLVKWQTLSISGIDFSRQPGKLSIERITAQKPYARVVIARDTSLNVARVLNPRGDGEEGASQAAHDEKAGSPSRGAAERGFPVRIGTIRLTDGSANFADYSIEPSFASGILDLNGSVTGLSSDPASRAQVRLEGKVDKYAPVDITGEVNLLAADVYTDLAMNFRNMELTTFNPYSGKFAGYSISKGKLSTELRYKVAQRKLDAAHHIVLDNLEFGDKTDSKDAAPIPMKLAVALLKDRNGVIDVNLPVAGTLDDPKFRLGPIIWKAVLGLLTKIVTAPFAALGALFGGGDELSYVEFPPGTAALSATETEKLNKLAKALVERPQLRLSVPLTVATAQDGEALAQASLEAALPPETPADQADEQPRRKRVALLEETYAKVSGSRPQYPADMGSGKSADPEAQLRFLDRALRERMQPDDAALTALARGRARAVQDVLLANTELNPERVFITADRTEGKSEGTAVRMEMKLE